MKLTFDINNDKVAPVVGADIRLKNGKRYEVIKRGGSLQELFGNRRVVGTQKTIAKSEVISMTFWMNGYATSSLDRWQEVLNRSGIREVARSQEPGQRLYVTSGYRRYSENTGAYSLLEAFYHKQVEDQPDGEILTIWTKSKFDVNYLLSTE